MRTSLRLLKNEPRFGNRFNRKALITTKSDTPAQFTPAGDGRTPQWLLMVGSFFGVFAAFALMQRLFPRQVHVIHKDENGDVISNPSRRFYFRVAFLICRA
jgi:hypothetical protein